MVFTLVLSLVVSVTMAQDYSCDAGLFAPEQFEGDYVKPALPIYSRGVLADIQPSECDTFPESGSCPDAIAAWAPGFLANLNLADPNVDNTAQPNGQVFCQYLGTQIMGADKAINGTNLEIHGRISGCCDGGCEWDEDRVFGVHEEELCCDGNSDWASCPLPIEPVHTEDDVITEW